MEACGSSLPSTAHSISRALTAASTSTLLSNASAARSAGSSSAADLTLLTPTDEPALAGFTNTGKPSSAACASVPTQSRANACAVTSRHGTTGIPACSKGAWPRPCPCQWPSPASPARRRRCPPTPASLALCRPRRRFRAEPGTRRRRGEAGYRRGHGPAAVRVDRYLQRAPHCLQAERARIACGAQQGLFSLGPPAALLVDADQHRLEAIAVERDENIAG